MQRSLLSVFIMLLASSLLLPVNPANAAEDVGGGAYYDLGVFALEDGDYQGAEANFTMALTYEPDNAVYLHSLGKVYSKTDRLREAEDAFLKTIALDPNLPGVHYDLALLYYNKKDYAKAADLFVKASKIEPGNVLALYHAGLCLHKLGRYDAALAYFLAASEKSPNIKDNGFYYAGTCYFHLNQIDNALEKFIYVRDHATSENLKENAIKYIAASEKKRRELKPYSLYAKVGCLIDDNVTLDPIDQDFPSDQNDVALIGYFSGTYDLIRTDALKIGAGYSHYQTQYNSLDQYNLIGSTGNFYARYSLNPFVLGFSILPAHYWLDTDDYMERYQFRPEIKYAVNEKFSLKAIYGYHIVNNMQFDDKDGHNQEAMLNFDYALPEKTGFLFGGIGVEKFSAQHADEDFDRYKALAGVTLHEATSGVYFTVMGEFSDKCYDNTDSFYAAKRSDDKYYLCASLSRRIIYDWLSLGLEYNFTKNDSNIDNFSYKKNAGSLALTANY
jgi:tetratricopeptide (TPR) repeat protein